MRQLLTTFIELAGMAAVSIGAGLAWLPAGLIIGGLFLIFIGFLASAPKKPVVR